MPFDNTNSPSDREIGLRRLERIAEFLETVPEKQFNMSYWQDKQPCGTVGCAVGWATTIPEFQEAGLRMVWEQVGGRWVPEFGGYIEFKACEEFFRLDRFNVRYLFHPNYYGGNLLDMSDPDRIEKHRVINRIRRFVAEHRAAPEISFAELE